MLSITNLLTEGQGWGTEMLLHIINKHIFCCLLLHEWYSGCLVNQPVHCLGHRVELDCLAPSDEVALKTPEGLSRHTLALGWVEFFSNSSMGQALQVTILVLLVDLQ